MKVYISSSYRDLQDYRVAVDRTLRRMGHDVIGMEQYVAEAAKPLERCRADVRLADVYVIIVAWRYGAMTTADPTIAPASFTELELREAQTTRKPILAFLLDPSVPWPPDCIDAMSGDQHGADRVAKLRSEVGTTYVAGIFSTPDDLASQVAAAIARQTVGQSMVERVLTQDSVNATDMDSFGKGGEINPSSPLSIATMVKSSGRSRALLIDLGTGDEWWSTRLYLLASLLKSLTSIRQIVFRAHDKFGGMASPSALLDGMAVPFAECAAFRDALVKARPQSSVDVEREIVHQTAIWQASVPNEPGVKVGVRAELLEQWLGERLVTRCLEIDESGPTLPQVQQIVDSLLPDLPIARRVPANNGATRCELQVICRDAFALALAREWVRSSLPRNPLP